MNRHRKPARTALLALLAAGILSASCVAPVRRYNRSISKASVFLTANQSRHLLPIEEIPVTVLTWTSWDGYKPGSMKLERDVWVTVVPQVREACDDFRRNKLSRRLEQLLGLPPDDGKTFFVEMEVLDEEDVFRPCTDPAVDSPGPCVESFPEEVSEEHVEWMARQAFFAWQRDGYPWTRLGYTYNWKRGASHVGPSEYVVRAGAEVNVLTVTETEDYCRPRAAPQSAKSP